MHIIKISTDSFKVILSQSDIKKYGSSALDGSESSRKMLNHILSLLQSKDKSTKGAIAHAEFFEDKFGGGELFLRLKKETQMPARYIFSSPSIEDVISASRLISRHYGGVSSRLFFQDGLYKLTIFSKYALNLFTERLREFGSVIKASKTEIWLIEEHASILIGCCAVERLIQKFDAH